MVRRTAHAPRVALAMVLTAALLAWVPSFAMAGETDDWASLKVMDKAADQGADDVPTGDGSDEAGGSGEGSGVAVASIAASGGVVAQAKAATGWQPKPTKTISGTGSFPLTINNGEIVQINGSITYTASAGKSPITVAEGATASIIINGNVTLNGADASGTTGATAGINVPEGSTLYIYSAHDEELSTSTAAPKDTLTVTGGDAAAGADGINAFESLGSNGNNLTTNYYTGAGGDGGGGAAAAVGGNGGNGGAGAESRISLTLVHTALGLNHSSADDNRGRPGGNGDSGSAGGNAGTVNINGRLTLNAIGGAGGAGGNGGSGDRGFAGTSAEDVMIGGCGGGGGGGGGCAAPAIGAGGSGGSGGGEGGEQGSDVKGNVQGPGGGGGGGGWPNGGGGGGGGAECSDALTSNDNTSRGGSGGSGGAAGSTGSAGSAGVSTGTKDHGVNDHKYDAEAGEGGAGGAGMSSASTASGGVGGRDNHDSPAYDGGDGGNGGASVAAKAWHDDGDFIVCTAANLKLSSSLDYEAGDGGGHSAREAAVRMVYDLMDCAVRVNPDEYTYTGSACCPSINDIITYSASSDRDGSLAYGDADRGFFSSSVSLDYGENVHCKTGTVIVTGNQDSSRTTTTSDGAAVGSKTVEFAINKAELTTSINADNANPYEGSPVTLSLSDYTSPTVGSGSLTDLLRESSQKYEGPQVKWEVTSGEGEFSGEGTQVTFTPKSSGTVKVRATLSDMNDFNTYTTVEFTITAQQRDPLTASLSTDTPHPRKEVSVTGLPQDVGSVSYQWKVNGQDVDGATNATYTPSNDDIGKTLSVVVTPGADSKYGEAMLTAANAVENHKWGSGTNGFCSVCDEYEPATLQSGTYRISNGGQLFWFAALVNGDGSHAEFDAQDTGADGALTGDVSLDNRAWEPARGFTGTFDGEGRAVSGFSMPDAQSDSGLFGSINGATVRDFTLEGSIVLLGDRNDKKEHVGGVVGQMTGGTLSGVTSNVNITSAGTSSAHIGGVVGNAGGGSPAITKCVFEGSIDLRSESECIGGVAGYVQTAQISYCANRGTVKSGASGAYVGGILGYANNMQASVSHCYNYGAVANGGGNYCGAIVGYLKTANAAAFTDNCHLDSSATHAYGWGGMNTSAIAQPTFSSDAFASGEACYWVNGGATDADGAVWRQDVDNGNTPYDAYPVFDGGIVLRNEAHDCAANSVTYSYSNSTAGFYHYNHAFANGFCSCCDAREAASEANGAYQIANGGQLFWFAEQLNSGALNAGASAVLVGDIDLEGSHDGEAAGYEGIAKDRNFPGIGKESRAYAGVFDGGGHTVSGFFMGASGNFRGFFGNTSGATLRDFTLDGSMALSDDGERIGGVVGRMTGGSLSDVTSNVAITGDDAGYRHVGGVVGDATDEAPSITRCLFGGSLDLENAANCVGGVVGYSLSAQISYCANLGTVRSGASSDAYVGGVLGYVNNTGTSLTHCYNYGTVQNGGGYYCGAIVGWLRDHTDASFTDNCYLDSSAPSAIGAGSNALSNSPTALSKARFDSGEACYIANGKTSTGAAAQWKQDVDNGITPYDPYPLFDEQGVVYYRSDDTYSNYPEEVSVTVTWGSMQFGYNEGTWDPDAHTYSGGWTPMADDANDLTVTNNSNVALGASFTFASNPALGGHDLTGRFNGYEQGVPSRMSRDGGTLSTELGLRSLGSVKSVLENQGEVDLGTVTVQLTTVGGGA